MKHPPAPLRVTPPLLREGERNLWPGETGSMVALDAARVYLFSASAKRDRSAWRECWRMTVSFSRAPRNQLCRAARAAPWGVTPKAAQGGASCGR